MGSARTVGVPGADGAGDPTASEDDSPDERLRRCERSGGAGLFEEIRRLGRSIFAWFATLGGPCSNVKFPSFVLRL
jgi:hypothetical protein